MRSTEAVITEILEAYGSRFGQWVRISEVAQTAGLSAEEIAAAIEELLGDEDFRAEPEPFNWRLTEADKAYGPVIGGEARHMIKWEA